MAALQEIRISALPSPVALYGAAAMASFAGKKAGVGLPAQTLVLPSLKVDAGHLQRYAQFCGYRAAQGVPPAYLHNLTFPLQMQYMSSRAFPWPVIGCVHLGFEMVQTAQVQAGETLRIEVSPGQLYAHEKGQVFSLLSKVYRGDQMIWSSVNCYLRMGVRSPVGAPFVSQLAVCDTLKRSGDWVADAGVGRRFSKVSGDINPIHLAAFTAKLLGFKQAIAHGMWTMARALVDVIPAQAAPQMKVQIEFKTPLFLPGKASLWTAQQAQGVAFEVRDGAGEKPHVRGFVSTEL